ncbi:cupredoxin domain-containing protein [Salinibacter altiplanensis]|uniref:cupredoxin domain-containing protein n=1 Tax=Salinibacter altiplanensis TaxID=1803181 RepID=UPI0018F889FD|nr:plastocyanin/azurin family copper-binding protein [Salinibacter altiplanensis]
MFLLWPTRIGRLAPQFLGSAGLLVLWMGALATPAVAQTSEEPAVTIGMTNTLSFTKDTVRVEVGETVRWENSSVIVHTVTADSEEATMEESMRLPEGAAPFHSGNLAPDETFEYTFETPGRYRYFCVPHEAAMRATVIVEPAGKG